jgi:hypothetical protein
MFKITIISYNKNNKHLSKRISSIESYDLVHIIVIKRTMVG